MANKTALCIGINNYPGTDSDLSGCVNDANDWTKELKARGYKVSQLLDAKATRANIVKEMTKVLTATKAGDTVVIQYSGHGSYVPDENGDEKDGKDECICPHDIVNKDGTGNFITDDELFEIYSKKDKDAKLILISDSCHSGSVSKNIMSLLEPSTKPRKKRFLSPSVFLNKKEMAKFGTRKIATNAPPPGKHSGLLMAGCQDYQVSYDAYFNNRANGAFSFVALKALKTVSKKAGATYADWFKLISANLPSDDYDQIPNLYGSSQMKKWKIF